MAKTRQTKSINFTFKQRRIRVFLDKISFLKFLRNLHGRFWGITGMSVMLIGFTMCFVIRPDLLKISTALSDFGNDVRTAPYFAGSVFFAAYGMWRWRSYLSRTWKHSMPVTGLITLTVIGLYMIALMPVSWQPWPYRIHTAGVFLAGSSMFATVVLDGLLTKSRIKQSSVWWWRLIRFVSFLLIIAGGWLTFGSNQSINWYDVSLLGESMLLAGYFLWICHKTYLGEGNRTLVSKTLKRFVLID